MDVYFRAVNAFIEDTCVLVTVAYLLARGPLLELLFRKRLSFSQTVYLGSVLGLVGVTEVAFPGARFPYATHTLIVTFATVAGRLRVGLITAAVVTLGDFILRTPGTHAVGDAAAVTVAAVFACALLAEAVRRVIGRRSHLPGGFIAGTLTQSGTLLIRLGLAGTLHAPVSLSHALISIPANGFGVVLLLLVVSDAQLRAESERHRAEAERAHALVAESQLNALRACVHPHFLFNTLTSIAGLCGIAPEKAEAAIVRLGQMMRRLLEANSPSPLSLEEELGYVQGYLEIERLRLGERLQVIWSVDPACSHTLVPPFAVQTLVENSVKHGISPKLEPGVITITVRQYPRHVLLAVADDGAGMKLPFAPYAREQDGARMHGLQILTQQLVLVYGPRARLRLFSRADVGTLAVFIVPHRDHAGAGGGGAPRREGHGHAHRLDRG